MGWVVQASMGGRRSVENLDEHPGENFCCQNFEKRKKKEVKQRITLQVKGTDIVHRKREKAC